MHKVKVLGLRSDATGITVEVLDRDSDDLDFWKRYVGAEVDHHTLGSFRHDGETVYLTSWVDEFGLYKDLLQNSVLTAMTYVMGRPVSLCGPAVLSAEASEYSVSMPEYIIELAQNIARLHTAMGVGSL